MIRLILDRTVRMSEDEFKRGYRTFEIENNELEKLMSEYPNYSICGAEVIKTPTSHNKDCAVPPSASPKLPSLDDVMEECYDGCMDEDTIIEVYNSIKKLGNFA